MPRTAVSELQFEDVFDELFDFVVVVSRVSPADLGRLAAVQIELLSWAARSLPCP